MFATEGTALIIEIIIGVSTLIAGFAGAVRWLTKHYFQEIKNQLTPNSGSSLKDQVGRLEADVSILKDHMIREEKEQDEMQKKIDKMYEILLDFISRKN